MRTDMAKAEHCGLRRLSDMPEFEVATGDPDVRGWPVVGPAGDRIGRVGELLVDPSQMKVRYLEVTLHDPLPNVVATRQRRVVVPIGAAAVEREHDQVRLTHESAMLARLPAYQGGDLTRDEERSICETLASELHRADPGGDIYTHPLYDADRFYAARRKGQQRPGGVHPHGPKP